MQPPNGCKWGYFRRIFAILGKIDEKQGKNTKKGVQINAPPIKKEQTLHLPMILGADRVGTISITSESVFFLHAMHQIETVVVFGISSTKLSKNR